MRFKEKNEKTESDRLPIVKYLCHSYIIISHLYISEAVNSLILTGPMGGKTVITH